MLKKGLKKSVKKGKKRFKKSVENGYKTVENGKKKRTIAAGAVGTDAESVRIG